MSGGLRAAPDFRFRFRFLKIPLLEMPELFEPLEPLEPSDLQNGVCLQDCPQMELEEVPDVAPAANEDVVIQQFQDAQVLPVEEGYHDVRLPVCFVRWLVSFSNRDHPG